jgi:hypothetical protein
MTDSLSKAQSLVVFKLLFTGETPLQSKLAPALKLNERNELIASGLIRLEPRAKGRGKQVALTDQAWEWASQNLKSELMVSKYATPALEAVLRRLDAFLRARSLTLADVFQVTPVAEASPVSETAPGPPPLPERIRQACLALSHGGYRVAIRLADLKQALPDAPWREIEAALLTMQQAAELSLQSIENPREISEVDHQAAIRILGQERHLIYLEK